MVEENKEMVDVADYPLRGELVDNYIVRWRAGLQLERFLMMDGDGVVQSKELAVVPYTIGSLKCS